MSNAKQQFDAEYQIVRKLLLQGKHTLATAKMWLHQHGVATAVAMQKETSDKVDKQAGLRSDRDIALLKFDTGDSNEDE